MSLPQVSADSVIGVETGVTTGIEVVVSAGTTVGMITGTVMTFGGEISGENTLPLVILLVPTMLPTSGSVLSETWSSAANRSYLTLW